MMKYMVLCLCFFALVCAVSGQSSFYELKIDSMGGKKTLDMNAYRGRKVLIVCVASEDSNYNQLTELSKLKTIVGDSLVILAVPSNSFGSEKMVSKSDDNVYSRQKLNGVVFTDVLDVKGSKRHPLYAWLGQKNQNGRLDSDMLRPFQKYLVNETGELSAIFSAIVTPTSTILVESIAISK